MSAASPVRPHRRCGVRHPVAGSSAGAQRPSGGAGPRLNNVASNSPVVFAKVFRSVCRSPRNGRIALALAVVYLVWGSTYLAVHVALGSFPPLLLSGLRNLFAGIGLFIFAARRKPVWPSAA